MAAWIMYGAKQICGSQQSRRTVKETLYGIEKKLKDLPPLEKQAKRQELIKPRLETFKGWLDTNKSKVPKDSLTYQAIHYALNQWETLTVFCEHGHLHMSNVLAENAIRPLAVGRRNWMFADTPRGARASACCCSLIETAGISEICAGPDRLGKQ
jgi:transposase